MPATWSSGWLSGDIVTAAEMNKSMGAVYDTTLGAAAATIDTLAVIPAGFANLLVVAYTRGDTAAAATALTLRFNNDSTASYDFQGVNGSAAVAAAGEGFAQTGFGLIGTPAASAAANVFGSAMILVPHYAGTTNNKTGLSLSSYKTGVASGNLVMDMRAGYWRSSAAISRVSLTPGAGNFVAGSRLTVYVMGA